MSADHAVMSDIVNEANGGKFKATFDRPGPSMITVDIDGHKALYPVLVEDLLYFAVVNIPPETMSAAAPVSVEQAHSGGGGSSNILELREAEERRRMEEEAANNLKGAAEIEEESPFADVSDNTSYAQSILRVFELGLMKGTDSPIGQVFNPTSLMDRAQFATVFDRLSMLHTIRSETAIPDEYCLFIDIEEKEWYAEHVFDACKDGIVIGHPDGSFKPIEFINYAEAIAIVVRTAAQFSEEVLEVLNQQIAVDTLRDRPWFEKYIKAAKKIGILTDEAFEEMKDEPWLPATRGWVADLVAHIPDL